jgi:hypothetical protein
VHLLEERAWQLRVGRHTTAPVLLTVVLSALSLAVLPTWPVFVVLVVIIVIVSRHPAVCLESVPGVTVRSEVLPDIRVARSLLTTLMLQ